MRTCQTLLTVLFFTLYNSQCPSFNSSTCSFHFSGDQCLFNGCTIQTKQTNTTGTSSNDWSLCVQTCCNTNPNIPQLLNSLNKVCSSGPEDEENSILYGVGLGVGSVFSLILLLYCCGLDKLKQILISPMPKMELPPLQFNNSINPVIENGIRTLVTENSMGFQSKGKMCCICLEGRTNVKAFCGHQYHESCIHEWYRRKMECPECRAKSNGRLFSISNSNEESDKSKMKIEILDRKKQEVFTI